MPSRLALVVDLPPAVIARAEAAFAARRVERSDLAGTEAEAVLTAAGVGFDRALIDALPRHVRVLATASVGFDHVDVGAARDRGLIVTNTPGVLDAATADMTMLHILAACRRAGEYAAIMRAGWRRRFGLGECLGVEVSGKSLGIVGMGRIGRAVARRARGFDMTVHYRNRARLPPELEEGAVYHDTIEDLLPVVDILCLLAPGAPDNDKLLNARRLALLPRGAVVVNTARGNLIDEDALLDALESGHLFAAGLDVFRAEPDFDRRFAALPNVFLTPHMASATIETRNAMGHRALDNVAAVLSGGGPLDPV